MRLSGIFRSIRRGGRLGAFTLLELLVVIAIMVLLVAILIPSLRRVRRQTHTVMCRSNLRQWGFVFQTYTYDNDGYFHNGDIGDWRHLWMKALWPYYKDFRAICFCPAAKTRSYTPRAAGNEFGSTFTSWTVFTGNYEWDEDYFSGSYGINGWTRNPPLELDAQYHGEFPTKWNWRRPDVKEAAEIPLFLDCLWPDGWIKHDVGPAEHEDLLTNARFCIDRHYEGVNCLLLDWSVRKIGPKELWTLKWHREFNTAGPWTRAGGVEAEDWPRWMRQFKDY